MKLSVFPVALFSFVLLVGMSPPAALASDVAGAPPTTSLDPNGTPDLNAGIDLSRMQDSSYVESLSTTAEELSGLEADVSNVLGNTPDLVDFGFMTGTKSLVVYWSGDPEAQILSDVAHLASDRGLGLVIAPRKVSRAQLEAAREQVTANLPNYKAEGIIVEAYGGFAADFDGLKITVNDQKSTLKDKSAIEASLRSSLSVPMSMSYADIQPASGKYDDYAPFYAGGLMVANNGLICMNGFGVVYGASVYRFLSARHCDDSPYDTETGANSYGSLVLAGSGLNGAAVFSGQGTYSVWTGSHIGNPTSTRLLTQRDPSLSTVGLPVCQEGGNSGQRCGTIVQVAFDIDDGQGSFIRTNYVYSGSSAKIAAQGDSGGPVISLHTQDRAWAVGILQAIQNYTTIGCDIRYPGNNCADNFFFSNIDYALSGLTAYGIRYY